MTNIFPPPPASPGPPGTLAYNKMSDSNLKQNGVGGGKMGGKMGGKIIGPQVSGAGGSQDTLNGLGKTAYQQQENQTTDIKKGGKKTRRKRSMKKKKKSIRKKHKR
jgi:hypothetical protein